jgi:hypothetical protein
LLADNAPKPDEDPFGFWIDVSVHGLEAGFILGDVFLNRSVCNSMPLHLSANDQLGNSQFARFQWVLKQYR